MTRALNDVGIAQFLTSRDRVPECAALNGIRARPDFVFARPSYYLVLEVDEHQHGHCLGTFSKSEKPFDISEFHLNGYRREGYTRDAELTRMMMLRESYAQPILFLRFNPDNFAPHNSESHDRIARSRIPPSPHRAKHIALAIAQLLAPFRDTDRELARTLIPHNMSIAFAYYDGQEDGAIDVFDIDTEAQKINRVAFDPSREL
jgi:hypothetical protein